MRPAVSDSLRASVPALVLSLLAACGQAPIPVDSSAASKSSTSGPATLPDGHPTGVPHPGMEGAAPSEATFQGSVRLEGKLASDRVGYLFVNVMPAGVRMPCYSRKFALADADPAIRVDGDALVVDFVLDRRYELGGLVPGDLVLEAAFDPDGYVDTKEPERVVATTAAKPGDQGLSLTLSRDPISRD